MQKGRQGLEEVPKDTSETMVIVQNHLEIGNSARGVETDRCLLCAKREGLYDDWTVQADISSQCRGKEFLIGAIGIHDLTVHWFDLANACVNIA